MHDRLQSNDHLRIVDPAHVDLEAVWEESVPWWMRTVPWLLGRLRHQAAVFAYGAIVATLWLIDARATDTVIVLTAMGMITAITIVAEWSSTKHDDQNRPQSAAQPRDARPDQTALG